MKEHHHVEVRDDIVHAERRFGAEVRDHAESGEDLEVVVVLKDEREFSAFGAEGEVVEDDVAVVVGKFCAFCFGILWLILNGGVVVGA